MSGRDFAEKQLFQPQSPPQAGNAKTQYLGTLAPHHRDLGLRVRFAGTGNFSFFLVDMLYKLLSSPLSERPFHTVAVSRAFQSAKLESLARAVPSASSYTHSGCGEG
jgi:hypothetical protein